jgi:hypothetical protein
MVQGPLCPGEGVQPQCWPAFVGTGGMPGVSFMGWRISCKMAKRYISLPHTKIV